jgi:excisionase family DNA binding protein
MPSAQPQHAQNDPARLLTREEACQWLSVSSRTLRRLIHDQQIDVVRVGTGSGSVRITQRALEDYARRRTVRASK